MKRKTMRGMEAPFRCKCGGKIVMLKEGWTCEDCEQAYELGSASIHKMFPNMPVIDVPVIDNGRRKMNQDPKMLTIWKYPLEVLDRQEISVPLPAQVLSVINQNGVPTLYCLVEPGASVKQVTIHILGTGHRVSRASLAVYDPSEIEGLRFIGTVNCSPFVWHIFQEAE